MSKKAERTLYRETIQAILTHAKGACLHADMQTDLCLDTIAELANAAIVEGDRLAAPKYTWKLVTWFGKSGNHTVSWYSSEEDATAAGEERAKPGDRPYKVTKQEVERCFACDE